MKQIIKHIAISLVATYLIVAFITLQINFINWEEHLRVMYAIFNFFLAWFVISYEFAMED